MRFCFITGAGRSGTTLVQALMDCHPECAVWPFELSFRELWINACEKSGLKDLSRCPRLALNETLLLNDRVKKLGGSIVGSATVLNTSGFNRDRFVSRLRKDEGRTEMPLSYLRHLGESFRDSEQEQVFVMRHNDLPHEWYHSNLPACHHIIMLREPVENYLAYQRFRIAGGYSFILDLPIGILTQFSMRRVFQGFLAADVKHEFDIPVRIEDISMSPATHMNIVADMLGIKRLDEWKPSIMGNPFSGNSTRGKSRNMKKFTSGYSRRLTKNEYDSFMKLEGLFTRFYSDMFEKIEIVSERADIEKLFQDRYTDGMNITDKQLRTEWCNLSGKLRAKYLKHFSKRIYEKELKALLSMDALLPDLVESPSWRNIPG